jgi:hypothetical protein
MFALRFLVIKFDPGGRLVSRSLSKCVIGHHFQSLSTVCCSILLLENMYQYLNPLLSLRAQHSGMYFGLFYTCSPLSPIL